MYQQAQRPRLKAVVFDLDDCLFPERQFVKSGYAAVAGALRKMTGRTERFEDWLWLRLLGGEYKGAIDAVASHFRLDLAPEQAESLVRVYREHRPSIRPYGGIPEMLGRLATHFRLGLLSDGYMPTQRLKLEALGLGRFFDAVVFTEELGRAFWKPSPKGFEVLALQLGAPHAACAYVGDNPAKDFVAPNALGWRTARLCSPGQLYCHLPAPDGGQPEVVADDLESLWRALIDPAA